MRANLRGALAVLCLATTTAAFADTAFDNFGENHDYFSGGGGTVAPGNDLGYQFMSLTSGILTSIEAAIVRGPSGAPMVNLALWTDDDGRLGGLLGSWSVLADGSPHSHAYVVAENTNPDIQLTAGEAYWLLADTSGNAGWYASLADTGNYVFGSPGSYQYNNGSNGAFAVYTADSVPEPATLGAIGLGIVALLRRRKA